MLLFFFAYIQISKHLFDYTTLYLHPGCSHITIKTYTIYIQLLIVLLIPIEQYLNKQGLYKMMNT